MNVSDPSGDNASNQRRDDLALVRTDLANERTLLAYGRTSLMVAATGATILKFFPDMTGVFYISWALIVLGVVVAVVGIIRFTRLQARLRS